MRKIITVAATLALMVAMSITAFAANPSWVEKEGEWSYIDKNGDAVTEKFVKSGENWFWLNEEGKLVANQLVEANDARYFVDEEGKMVVNKWELINNDDYENRWMFFGANGKAFKDGWKTINSKKYFFEDYCMNYGFLDAEGKMFDTDVEDPWKDATYYCGSNDKGYQVTGWVQVDSADADNGKAWLYFGVNGKKYANCTKTINGASYVFNADGSMKVSFSGATVSVASPTSITKYSDENGSIVKKGWIWAFADDDAEEAHWYYATGNGQLVKGCVKTINNKKYAFNDCGEMLTGFVEIDDNMTVLSAKGYAAADVKFADVVSTGLGNKYMYFIENEDPKLQGAAVTGKTTIEIEDAKITVNFSSRGIATSSAGAIEVKKGYAYINSVLYAREDMDAKYEVIMDVNGDFYILTVKTGRAANKGTFTDNDNEVKYIIKDGVVTIQHKNSAGKWE